MKRFTARFRTHSTEPIPDPIRPEQVRKAVVEALLHAPLPAAYQIGTVDLRGDETRVEIASDATREALLETLASIETRLPVQLESLRWGWLISEAAAQVADETASHRQDPYRTGAPQKEPERTYPYTTANTVKMVLSCLTYASPLVMVALILSNPSLAVFYQEHELTVLLLWLGFITFLAFLGVFRFPTRWARWVRTDSQGITVKHWLQPRARSTAWEDVETLEVGNDQVVLRGKGRSHRFIAEGLAGKDTLAILVRTIVDRAGLHFTESEANKVIYRRFEKS